MVAVRTIGRLGRRLEAALVTTGLTASQYRVLVHLDRAPSFPSDLADRFEMRRPSITQMVDGLIAAGFVSKTPSSGDRRRVCYELTPAGRTVLRDADESIDRVLGDAASHLTAPERRRAYDGLLLWAKAMDAQVVAALDARRSTTTRS